MPISTENRDVILFDLDGVLIDSEPQHFRAWRRTMLQYGVDIDFEHYKPCIGSTDGILFRIFLEYYGFDAEKHPELTDKYTENRLSVEREEGILPMPGVRETVRTLHGRGYRMAVASSSPQDYIEYCVRDIGVSECFACLFSGRRAPRPKPAPDTFLMAAEMLGADPARCVVIEDSENGSRAAKAAGMLCIGIDNPGSGDQDLSAADMIITELRELLQVLPGIGENR